MAGLQSSKARKVIGPSVSHDDGVREDLQTNPAFRREFLIGALRCIVEDELDLGKHMLRKYINGTVGFIKLGEALGKSPKTLMQMLGPKGNPQIRNFFEIVEYLRKTEKMSFDVVARSAPKRAAKKAA